MKQKSTLEPKDFIRIGELARRSGETTATLNFWTEKGLLNYAARTEFDYRLYSPEALNTIREIRSLQKKKRLTLEEIKERISRK